jgi:hypothetical protein
MKSGSSKRKGDIMKGPLVTVVFDGAIAEGRDINEVKAALATLFKKDVKQIEPSAFRQKAQRPQSPPRTH